MPAPGDPMQLSQLLEHGGWAMWPIYLCSAAALMVTLQRVIVYRAARLGRMGWLSEVLAAAARADVAAAVALCRASPHPAARAIQAMVEVWQGRPDRAEAEAARVGSTEVQRLERHLSLLSFVARVAPLLGLLGTVIGMVRLFISMEHAGPGQVDVRVLSAGIWQALLTTAAGVVVAVPTLAAHAWLQQRADGARLQIHDAVERMLTALPAPAGAREVRPLASPRPVADVPADAAGQGEEGQDASAPARAPASRASSGRR